MANVNFFSPDGGTTRYPIEDTEARSRVAGQQSLLKDTVGWTGKNLLKNIATSQTINGVTFTVNADKSVTINGTATDVINFIVSDVMPFSSNSPYILNGCPAGGTFTTYRLDLRNSEGRADNDLVDYGDGCLCNKSGDYYVNIRIASGATVSNLTFYPMLRKADITDPTYEPYHESVEEEIEQIYADNGVLGAKNLLPNNAKSQTINGVTFTVNADGSITANGTASARSELIFLQEGMTNHSAYYSALAGKSVILSGCPSGGAFDKYFFGEWDSTNNNNTNDYGEGIELSFPQSEPTTWNIKIRIESGQTVSNLVFKPMLRLASDPDDTYQPYAMTNRELTEKVFEKRVLTSADDLNDITETGIYKIRTAPVNSPESVAYVTLIVCKYDASDINQMIYKGGSSSGNIYVRSKGGSPSAWTSWYKFTGTVVS